MKPWSHASAEIIREGPVAEGAHTLTVLSEHECDVKYVAELVIVCRLAVLEGFALGRLEGNSVEMNTMCVAIYVTHRQVEDGLPQHEHPLVLPALQVGFRWCLRRCPLHERIEVSIVSWR